MLVVHDLEVFYADVQALWGVSFHVDAGEVVALLGSNGTGKTTTLRTVSGLLDPASGSIAFDDRNITTAGTDEIVAMGLVQIPEGRQLWPDLTVQDNLRLGAYSHNAREKFEASLAWVYELFPRLEERRHQRAGTLSGGEQQMCAIARGLMARPTLLMLDEPSLGLAPMLVETVFDVLDTINHEGVTILLVEQNVHQTLQLADRAYVLETGRVALEGSAAELAASEYVQRTYLGIG
jgi:branched-chain amino acid transport system ATP-binding protein